MQRLWILLIVLLGCCFATQAQSRKKKEKVKDEVQSRQQASSRDPEPRQVVPSTKKRKASKSDAITYSAEARYYKQKELVAKERRKAELELEKPQYSNPAYFGHKRPPKKHRAGKMKYCKECGIRH